MQTKNQITTAEKTWTEVMAAWTPIYDYERPLIPFIASIQAANLDPKKIACVVALFGGEAKYTHDRAQNIMTIPDDARAAEKKARQVRKDREEARMFPARAKQNNALHLRISSRAASVFLERQKEIDFRLLATAHAMPGLSMDDNLRRCSHPSAKRLLAA